MAVQSILDWMSIRPAWQRDALRRIALSHELVDEDISTILSNLKNSKGLSVNSNSELQLLEKSHLQSDAQEARLSVLCSVSHIKNTNHLAPDQTLKFAIDGITLIYGQNGSGKSGYCRILKKICRAIIVDHIHPDVFESYSNASAEARIRYQFKDATNVEEFTWRDGEDTPSDVAHISVFDSSNTRLYVDRRNRIDYLPYEVELLKRFAQLFTTLRSKLKEEIVEVETRLRMDLSVGYSPNTRVSKLVNRLTQQTPLTELPTISELKEVAEWTDRSAQELEKLGQALSSDPRVLAERCRRVQGALSRVSNDLTKARNALSQESALELKKLVKQAHSLAKTAYYAATELSESESLKHLDSDEWELMFHYAREYSKLVYPNVGPTSSTQGRSMCAMSAAIKRSSGGKASSL